MVVFYIHSYALDLQYSLVHRLSLTHMVWVKGHCSWAEPGNVLVTASLTALSKTNCIPLCSQYNN